MGPADPVLGVAEAFKKDTAANKINLSIGAYRDNNGKPWVLPSVKDAEKMIVEENRDMEYLPMQGYDKFVDASVLLALGKSKTINDKNYAAIQVLSGTGGCRVGFEFLKYWGPNKENTVVHIPDRTWGNHFNIAQRAGLSHNKYS